jgi:DNA-binding NarL/FixJ family response regulator
MKKIGQKILIVDDSRIFVNRLTSLLREANDAGEIITEERYEEVLPQIIKHKPDVVFLDVHLHNRCGIDLLKVIRLSGWDCKVIMLTNETKKAYRYQCEKLGSSGYLDKSNDFEEIPELLKEL